MKYEIHVCVSESIAQNPQSVLQSSGIDVYTLQLQLFVRVVAHSGLNRNAVGNSQRVVSLTSKTSHI